MIQGVMPSSVQNPLWSQPARLRLVYNNDLHEHWEALAKSIQGFRQLSRQGENAGMDVLRLNAGDSNTGPEPREWELTVRLMNLLGLHASTLGNHELDLSPADGTQTLAQWANFPMLASNIKLAANSIWRRLFSSGHLQTQARIVEGRQGRYGLIGITQPAYMANTNKKDLTLSDFADTCRAVQAEINRLQQQGVDKILVLSHMGYGWDKQLAQQVVGVDVILGGDSHDTISGITPGQNLIQSPAGEPVLLLQAGANGQYVGVTDLQFDAWGRIQPLQNQLYSSEAFAADLVAMQLIAAYLPPKQTVAYLLTPYDNSRIHYEADQMAQFVADAMRRLTGTDIGLVRSSEIRKPAASGWMSDWDLKQMMPYPGPVACIFATGREIWASLQRAAADRENVTRKTAPLLHASGLQYIINRRMRTVVSATVYDNPSGRWVPLDPDKRYTISLSEYAVSHPQEFPELAHPERIYQRIPWGLSQLCRWGFQQLGAPWGPVAMPPVDQRLRIL